MFIEYYYLKLNSNQEQLLFFDFALKNQLYLTSDDLNFKSRLLNFYQQIRKHPEISIILAIVENTVAGLVFCENTHEVIPIFHSKENRNGGFHITDISPYTLHNVGFLSFYVHPLYRRLGIAKNLIQHIESHRSQEVSLDSKKLNFLSFNVREKAIDIIDKYSHHSFALKTNFGSHTFPSEINDIYNLILSNNPLTLSKKILSFSDNKLCINTNLSDIFKIINYSSQTSLKKYF